MCAEGASRGRKRDRSGLDKDGGVEYLEGSAPPSRPPRVPVVKEKKPPKEAKLKKEKEPKKEKELKEKENAGNKKMMTTAQVMQPLGGRVTIDTRGRMVLHPNQHGNTKVDSSGSSEILLNERLGRMKESMWPTFMDHLGTREKLYAPRSMSEYMEDLELSEEDPPPSRFRLRGRIGRGGRVVMDRIPIYNRCHDPESWRTQPHLEASHSSAHSVSNHYDYIYPTTLHPARHQEHVKMFASHFPKEVFYRAGLPDALQPACSEDADGPLDFPMDVMDVDVVNDKPISPMASAINNPEESNSSGAMTSFGGKIKPSTAQASSLVAPVEISSVENVVDGTVVHSNSKTDGGVVGINIATVNLVDDCNTMETDEMKVIPPASDDVAMKQEVCSSPSSVEERHTAVYTGSGGSVISSFPGVCSSEYQCAYKYSDDLTMFPLLVPPERDALSCLPSHREMDLFRLSDQRPRDPKADPQLPLVLQANHLVPREDEGAESIISMPRRFNLPSAVHINQPSAPPFSPEGSHAATNGIPADLSHAGIPSAGTDMAASSSTIVDVEGDNTTGESCMLL
jgi:hypothetical protein